MLKINLLLLLLGVAVPIAYCQIHPTASEVLYIADEISALIDANSVTQGGNTEFPFIAGFVRLSFHDCAGDGRCDGCIDHTLADNKGLKRYTDVLDANYTSDSAINTKITRADFYILAAYVALERATEHTTDKFVWADHFRTGRISCLNSPDETAGDDPGFPSGMDSFTVAHTFFSNQFGFSETDSVAIMGAHTLGRCKAENSGFEGKWIRGRFNGHHRSDMLDNEYYLQIRGNWTQFAVESDGGATFKNQWQRPQTGAANDPDTRNNQQPNMFLNVDMGIQWNLETLDPIDSVDGSVTCEVVVDNGQCFTNLCCDRATTNSRPNNIFRGFVNSNSDWLSDFTEAFNKMVESNPNTDFRIPAV